MPVRAIYHLTGLPEILGLSGMLSTAAAVAGAAPQNFEIISLAGVVSVLLGFLWAGMQWFRALQQSDRDRIKHLEVVVEQQNDRILEYSDRFRDLLLQAGDRAHDVQQAHSRQVDKQQDHLSHFESQLERLIDAMLAWAENKPACLAGQTTLADSLSELQDDVRREGDKLSTLADAAGVRPGA